MPFAAKLLLPLRTAQCPLRCLYLGQQDSLELRVVGDIIVCLHGGEANLIFKLFLFLDTHQDSGPGDLHVVDGLKAIEELNPCREGVAVVE